MQKKEEQKYLEELSSGSHDAFHYFFITYYPKVKVFINFFVRSEDVAEDLSQDIFEKIWLNREFASNLQSFNSYVYRLAKNAAINYMEHKTIEGEYISSASIIMETSIEEEIDAKELKLLIQLTVEKMPEQRRKIYNMSRIEGMKNGEIAEQLNISKRTVEAHINQALKQIKEITAILFLFF